MPRLGSVANSSILRHSAGHIVPSEKLVKVRLPTIAAEQEADSDVEADEGVRELGSGLHGESEAGSKSASAQEHPDAEALAVVDAGVQERSVMKRYKEMNSAGAPLPLAQGLLTLSGEATTKWESLVHLDAIKVLVP